MVCSPIRLLPHTSNAGNRYRHFPDLMEPDFQTHKRKERRKERNRVRWACVWTGSLHHQIWGPTHWSFKHHRQPTHSDIFLTEITSFTDNKKLERIGVPDNSNRCSFAFASHLLYCTSTILWKIRDLFFLFCYYRAAAPARALFVHTDMIS